MEATIDTTPELESKTRRIMKIVGTRAVQAVAIFGVAYAIGYGTGKLVTKSPELEVE